jgi:hypothetical protein
VTKKYRNILRAAAAVQQTAIDNTRAEANDWRTHSSDTLSREARNQGLDGLGQGSPRTGKAGRRPTSCRVH